MIPDDTSLLARHFSREYNLGFSWNAMLCQKYQISGRSV
jgi:hypothetical protein